MIGERLKEERLRLGYNQPDFAAAADAAKRTLIDWEKGSTSPSAVQLSALTKIGVDVLYVLTGQRAPLARAAETAAEYTVDPLSMRERALLANYRGSTEEGRRAVESTASALAHRDSGEKKGKQGSK